MGKSTVSAAFKKKNERRLRERQRRGQNHVRVYDPSDFDSSFADTNEGDSIDRGEQEEDDVDDNASEASTATAIADMEAPAHARSTSRQRRRSSGATGNFRKKFNQGGRGHSKSRSEHSPGPFTDAAVLHK